MTNHLADIHRLEAQLADERARHHETMRERDACVRSIEDNKAHIAHQREELREELRNINAVVFADIVGRDSRDSYGTIEEGVKKIIAARNALQAELSSETLLNRAEVTGMQGRLDEALEERDRLKKNCNELRVQLASDYRYAYNTEVIGLNCKLANERDHLQADLRNERALVASQRTDLEQAKKALAARQENADILSALVHAKDLKDRGKTEEYENAKHGLWERAFAYCGLPMPKELFCPKCGMAHIDRDESLFQTIVTNLKTGLGEMVPLENWTKKLHKTHLCRHCKTEWQPYEYPTVGVSIERTAKAVETVKSHRQEYSNGNFFARTTEDGKTSFYQEGTAGVPISYRLIIDALHAFISKPQGSGAKIASDLLAKPPERLPSVREKIDARRHLESRCILPRSVDRFFLLDMVELLGECIHNGIDYKPLKEDS